MIHPTPHVVSRPPLRLEPATEDFLAELTDAAYRVALKHRFEGSFLDVQLDLWSALRSVLTKDRTP
jgi:hypothetical protein